MCNVPKPVRIASAEPLDRFMVRLVLTDGRTLERDLADLLTGEVFEAIRADPALFQQLSVDHGTLCWPGDIDVDPDMVIRGGPPPRVDTSAKRRPARPR